MTYKFKSKATGDLLMLDADGRRLLEIIGKDAGPTGIILPAQTAAAVQALEQAIAADEAQHGTPGGEAAARDEAARTREEVSLRQRAVPFIDMLRLCGRDGTEIVWGV